MKDKNIVLGVDIGGSHITAAAVNLEQWEIIPGTFFNKELNNKDSKELLLETWAETINQSLLAGTKGIESSLPEITGIGIAMPGPFDYPRGIGMFEGNDKYENLYKVNVRAAMSEFLELPQEKLQFFNDASSFALGAALQKEVVHKRTLCLTLGTGFGAAFLLDELPAIENKTVPENGCLWDKPFKEGIADDYFSTRWFTGEFERRTGSSCSGVREILEMEEESIFSLFGKFVENLTEFLLPYLERFDAEVLLIGGNIAKAHPYFLEGLKTSLAPSQELQIEIVENTETCNILGSSKLMALNYWKHQSQLKSFF